MEPNLPASETVLLDDAHDVSAFDCGILALNDYLKKHALANNRNRSARTFSSVEGPTVVGYYTLVAGSVSKTDVAPRIGKGLGNYPIPIILLARLAVDSRAQGRGLGKKLLQDALIRAVRAAELIGCRAIVVQATNDAAKTFYQKWGFEPSPTDELHLCLLMKDLLATLQSSFPSGSKPA